MGISGLASEKLKCGKQKAEMSDGVRPEAGPVWEPAWAH
jgi:hypothetical protein